MNGVRGSRQRAVRCVAVLAGALLLALAGAVLVGSAPIGTDSAPTVDGPTPGVGQSGTSTGVLSSAASLQDATHPSIATPGKASASSKSLRSASSKSLRSASSTSLRSVSPKSLRSASSSPADAATSSPAQSAPSGGAPGHGGTGDDVVQTTVLERTPDRPGSYDARVEYVVPEPVVELTVTLPERATVLRARGFAVSGGEATWDRGTAEPSLRLRVPANRTVDREDPIAGPGAYQFVDVGEWGIVQRPGLGHSWSWVGERRVGFRSELRAEPGEAGDVLAYLGAAETTERDVGGQTVRLVEPASADLAEDREAVLDELAYGADALRVGERDPEVLVVAAPTGRVEWGARGVQTGSADVWVRDVEPLDDVDNVWLHEYVHTRQDWATDPSARWVTEATATYYAALLTLERGGVDFETFRRRLGRGESADFDGVALEDPATWRRNPEYHVGALVAAHLDRRIRAATGGERSLQDVLRRLNAGTGPVDAAALASAALAVVDEAVVGELSRYVASTSERPATWDAAEHDATFGTPPSRIGYRPADPSAPLAVSGPYRERPLGDDRILVPGERVHASVTVENAGGTPGNYEATLRLDDEVLDAASGRLGPGASATVSLSGAVSSTGPGELRAGDVRYPVEVREPATAAVADVSVEEPDVRAGEPVPVRVTLRNDAGWPAERRLVLASGLRTLNDSTVRLDARETRTVTRTVRFGTSGSRTVRVRDADVDGARVAVSGGWSPATILGFAAVALVLAAVGLLHRRRSRAAE